MVIQPVSIHVRPVDLNILQLRGRLVEIKSRRQFSPLRNTTEKCREDMKLISFLVLLVASFTKDYTFVYMAVVSSPWQHSPPLLVRNFSFVVPFSFSISSYC